MQAPIQGLRALGPVRLAGMGVVGAAVMGLLAMLALTSARQPMALLYGNLDLNDAAQATEQQRRAVADVWLDNSGTAEELVEVARTLWHDRIVPFAHNVQVREPARVPPRLVPSDPSWPDQARRIVARLNTW